MNNKVRHMWNFEFNRLTKVVLLGLFSLISPLLLADDTEVLFSSTGSANPNVLFVMDNSGSMVDEVSGTAASGTEFSIKRFISERTDDAEENADNTMDLFSSDLELVTDKQVQKIGLRYANLNIPKDANILEAYIQFQVDEVNSAATSLNIQIEQADNPGTFLASNSNISSRSLSATSITWVPASWDAVYDSGAEQKSPSLTSLVQAQVQRAGWQKGNAMVFVISGSGKRVAQAFEMQGGPGSPYLFIKYQSDTQDKTRMMVMREALATVLTEAPDNLSVGLMNYGDTIRDWKKDHPNGVKFPITPINSLARPIVEDSITVSGTAEWWRSNIPEPDASITVRDYLSEIAKHWEPSGMTPIVDSLYEAALYYRGETVQWGYERANYGIGYAAHPATYEGDPIDDPEDYNSCDTTYSKEIWNGDIDEWRAGETWSNVCPADRLNPVGPGEEAHCAATEHDCVTYDYYECLVEAEVIGCNATDEDGNCTDPVYAGGDQCSVYSTEKARSCNYEICNYSKIPPPKYKTPMTGSCQSNFIVLMTDGKPEYKAGTNTFPPTYEKFKNESDGTAAAITSACDVSPSGFQSGRCGAELTHFLSGNDNSATLEGNQFINTYVIGFSTGITADAENYLKSLVTLQDDPATENKEGYFSALNTEELTAAFQKALVEIAQEARSQASPAYSVNVKNGLQHDNSVYIPVFDKNGSSRWGGNLKKFRLETEGNNRVIKGKVTKAGNAQGVGYVDAMTEMGLFADNAWDEWSGSDVPDGNDVTKGGAASHLTDPAARKLYTDISTTKNLTADTNLLTIENSLITNNVLGIDTEATAEYRAKLIQFIRGWENGDYDESAAVGDRGKPRLHMGDILHAEPVVITYQKGDENTARQEYVFVATNEGFLHVIDSNTGVEKFAYMPSRLLKNIESQFTTQGEHLYGVDGNMTYWHDDTNHDNNVDSGEKVYLYFGLRRGGRAYYALDISNINSPQLLWKLDNNSTGFSRLGESWSMPYLAKMRVGDVVKPVVIFSGGNDPDQDYGSGETYDPDTVTTDVSADMGDDIYIVDATTGSLLWSMRETLDNTDVTHAIPGGVRILDVNRNGLLDRLYFADTGGKVWRLDLDENLSGTYTTSDTNSELTLLADLGGTDDAARKFYNEPDVASLRVNGKTFFTVALGSGLRPHPMNKKIKDYMFVLLDESPYQAIDQENFESLDISDLTKITISKTEDEDNPGNITKSVSQETVFKGKKITETGKKGWYLSFADSGEKVLAPSLTFKGTLLFTTLAPETDQSSITADGCQAPATQGRVYSMNILTGKPALDINEDGSVDDEDVFKTISGGEIPGTPQTFFNALSCDADNQCTHNVDIRIGKKKSEIATKNVAEIEGVYWNDPQ